ncbi:MAG: hypothetical protein KC713_06675 [Candidatus Omnitrophica bacterium]|nr:hypothetical protein [Candidatus Omnitrophota bacterium]
MKQNKKAQTAVELAVFGAILIFVLGLIIRQAMSYHYLQNQNYRAMRMAMQLSYRHSEGLIPTVMNPPSEYGQRVGNSSRNSASVLLVEDRLSVGSDRFAQRERVPYIAIGSATNSRNLFMPTLEDGVDAQIPRMDVFINGKHFPLTVAAFRTVNLTETYINPENGNTERHPDWDPQCAEIRQDDGTITYRGCRRLYQIKARPKEGTTIGGFCWNDSGGTGDCAIFNNLTARQRFDLNRNNICMYPGPDCDQLDQDIGILDPMVCCENDNTIMFPGTDELNPDYSQIQPEPDDDPSTPKYSEREISFDSLENNVPNNNNFSWQWVVLKAWNRGSTRSGYFLDPNGKITTSLDGVLGYDFNYSKTNKVNSNLSADVDGDLLEERVLEVEYDDDGFIYAAKTIDYQEGDVDFSRRNFCDSEYVRCVNKPASGFMSDAEYFSFVSAFDEDHPDDPNKGTIMRTRNMSECEVGGATPCQTSTQKKEQLDVVVRYLQLNRDTDRFCGPDQSGSSGGIPVPLVDGLENPVEVCCSSSKHKICFNKDGSTSGDSCASAQNRDRTCMDEGHLERIVTIDNPDGTTEDVFSPMYPIIFVRSRILDRHGRKWFTNMGEDPYVNYDYSGAE